MDEKIPQWNQEMELRSSCRTLLAPEQVTEVRILGLEGRNGHIAPGWFDNPEALVASVLENSAKGGAEGSTSPGF